MRAALGRLVSYMGLALALVLLVAGGLLTWANSFVADQVKQQLSAQHITMPEEAALETQEQKDALLQYAGQPLETGDQARAYADQYILVHMNQSSNNRTYSQVSGEFTGGCTGDNAAKATTEECQELGQLRQSLFMGNTLRGLLLYGYAFGTVGKIAGYAAIAAFIGAAVMLVLALLGLRHAKRADAHPATA